MIRYEITDLQALRETFDPRFLHKAVALAMDVAARKTRVRLSRQVRQTYNIKAGDVARAVTLRRITDGRVLMYQGRMIGLDKFSPSAKSVPKRSRKGSAKRTGVTIRLKKDSGRKLVKGGFVGGANRLIFKRTGDDRLPIKRLFGPSIAHMIGNKNVMDDATRQTGEDAAVEFDRYLTYLMEQAHR